MSCPTLPRGLSFCIFTANPQKSDAAAFPMPRPNSTLPEKFRKMMELFVSQGVGLGLGERRVSPPLGRYDPEKRWSGDVPITTCCRTLAVAAPLCTCADRKSGLRRRVCRRDAG